MATDDLMTNPPLESILDYIPARLDLLFVLPGKPLPVEIPDHDFAFGAASNSDERAELLNRIELLTEQWPRPFVQYPAKLLNTSRKGIFTLQRHAPGIEIPPIARVTSAKSEGVCNEKECLEEARAMQELDGWFARRHSDASREIGGRIGLRYSGIDCAETPGGELLIFEADAAMVIHAVDPPRALPVQTEADGPGLQRLLFGASGGRQLYMSRPRSLERKRT